MGELSCSADWVMFQLAAILPFPKSCQGSASPGSCLCRWTVCTAPSHWFMENFQITSLFMLLEQRGCSALPRGDCSHPLPAGQGMRVLSRAELLPAVLLWNRRNEPLNPQERFLAISAQRHRLHFLTSVVQQLVQFLLPLGSNFPYQLVSLSMVITSSRRAGSTTSL